MGQLPALLVDDVSDHNPAQFTAYVEQVVVPTLAKADIVFMDNLRTHKIDGVRETIAAAGATIRYLPAYSPDLNPIEILETQSCAARRRQAHCEGTLAVHRKTRKIVCARPMRKLFSSSRL
jgi:transposase